LTLDKGYLGLSYSDLRANYGTVAQPDVRVDMKTSRLGIAGEVRELGTLIDGVKFKYNHTDYSHNELESGVVGTTFTNKGYETRVDATHTKLGPLSGAFGMQLSNTDFAAIGTEAFVPKVNTDTRALFAYEEAALGNTKLSASVRNEHASLESAGGDHFGAAQTRSFSASSGSLGTLHTINPNLNWATNLSHTERVPTYAELFANGRHVATGQFEVGNTALSKEKSNGADTQLRWHSGLSSASIGGFYNRFPSYIALIKTGAIDAGTNLPVAAFRATRAELYGFEMEEKTRVYETKGSLDLSLRSDYVRAKNLDTGDSLPRIAPMRFGAGLDYRLDKLGARLDVTHSMRQNQVAANELPTDGYTLTNAMVDYHFKTQAINWETYLKGNNLFNQEARMHTSTIKEIAPLPGRGFMMGIRGNF
jgi:iron complex outermembrane receptor protein